MITMVPRIPWDRPPTSLPLAPMVLVVSTLHCQCGTARATTPTASQTVGVITSSSAMPHSVQKMRFPTRRRIGTAGQAPVPGARRGRAGR